MKCNKCYSDKWWIWWLSQCSPTTTTPPPSAKLAALCLCWCLLVFLYSVLSEVVVRLRPWWRCNVLTTWWHSGFPFVLVENSELAYSCYLFLKKQNITLTKPAFSAVFFEKNSFTYSVNFSDWIHAWSRLECKFIRNKIWIRKDKR